MFLRVTHAVSRRQEYVADELSRALRPALKPMADGLRTVHGMALAFDAYWRNECAPVLNAGFRPPLVEGFEKFIQADHIAEAIDKHVDEELKTSKANPYNTHPPLKDRIAALAKLPVGEIPANDLPALLAFGKTFPRWKVNWSSLSPDPTPRKNKAHPLERRRRAGLPFAMDVAWQAPTLKRSRGVTPEALPQFTGDLKQFGSRFVDFAGMRPTAANAPGLASGVVGATLSILLISNGATVDTAPGSGISVTVRDITIEPFAILSSLAEGKMTPEAWSQQCAALAIAGQDLGLVAKI